MILAEGDFGVHHGKTAVGVIRYGTDPVLAVIDSTQAGGNVSAIVPGRDIPIIASLDEALAMEPRPTALLIGIAPTGGRLPQSWRTAILQAIEAGLDVLSGLHTFIGDDPEFAEAARRAGTEIVDYRRPPERMETAVGRPHRRGSRVILTVGTDCAIGKMSVALELRKSALAANCSAVFVPTGQTGMMIDGWGVAVDRVISDFVQGTCEWMLEEAESRGDWIIVEGQGSLDHPAYSSVTLGLIHGMTPHAMVLVHKPGLADHDFDHLPDRSFPIAAAQPLHRAPRAGGRARRAVEGRRRRPEHVADRLGRTRRGRRSSGQPPRPACPVDDPVRFGADGLWAEIEQRVDALPWV